MGSPITSQNLSTQLIEPLKTQETENINPLDQIAGLRNVGGNKALYQKILMIFLNENQKTNDELQAAINSNDYPNAVQIVHKIKGSCSTIGAPALYQTAMNFQKALQDEDRESINLLHHEFAALLKSLLNEIASQKP